jgi:hypothetical protein
MDIQKPWLLVRPAYWRIYMTNEAMRKDWDEGKDFQIYAERIGTEQTLSAHTPYMSRRDLDKNTMDIKSTYAGIQIVQTRPSKESSKPYLTKEITW